MLISLADLKQVLGAEHVRQPDTSALSAAVGLLVARTQAVDVDQADLWTAPTRRPWSGS